MVAYDIKCTGCGACLQKCPKNCIQMKEAELGVLYPEVDTSLCIGCNMCDNICPINFELKKPRTQKSYAVKHKDSKILSDSSSGGFFTAIAEWILNKSGIVYGCAFDENLNPVMTGVEISEDLYCLRGSKYVQSDTTKVYTDVKKCLEQGKNVLFTGLPCQVAGLKSFLGKDYDSLLCVDLVCHGVPSAKYFLSYIHQLENKTKSKIYSFHFRTKHSKRGLSGTYSGIYSGIYLGTQKKYTKNLYYFNSYYYSYFLTGEINRSSCYSCKYANMNRVGDFTIGDLWGMEGMPVPFSNKNGCSLVLTNTAKANAIIGELNIEMVEILLEDAVKYNKQLHSPTSCPEQRKTRINEYEKCDFDEIEANYFKSHRKQILLGRIKYAIPKPIKHILLRIRYHK